MAKLFPCTFYSLKPTPAEANYDFSNWGLLPIKEALEEWQHWLKGARYPLQVITNQRIWSTYRSASTLIRQDWPCSLPTNQGWKIVRPSHIVMIPYTSPCVLNLSCPHLLYLEPILPPAQTSRIPYVPRVVRWVHTAHSSGHPGIQMTMSLFQNAFWWHLLAWDMENNFKVYQLGAEVQSPIPGETPRTSAPSLKFLVAHCHGLYPML